MVRCCQSGATPSRGKFCWLCWFWGFLARERGPRGGLSLCRIPAPAALHLTVNTITLCGADPALDPPEAESALTGTNSLRRKYDILRTPLCLLTPALTGDPFPAGLTLADIDAEIAAARRARHRK